MQMSREEIVAAIDSIINEYHGGASDAYTIGQLVGLQTATKLDCIRPDVITLADVDRMALETLTMTGEITIREDTPPSPSVGWPGSDDVSGEITGRFEVPAGVMIVGPYTQPHITIEECAYTVSSYLTENPDLWEKIVDHCDIPQKYSSYKPEVYFLGTTPSGDRAVVEFKVVVKEV